MLKTPRVCFTGSQECVTILLVSLDSDLPDGKDRPSLEGHKSQNCQSEAKCLFPRLQRLFYTNSPCPGTSRLSRSSRSPGAPSLEWLETSKINPKVLRSMFATKCHTMKSAKGQITNLHHGHITHTSAERSVCSFIFPKIMVQLSVTAHLFSFSAVTSQFCGHLAIFPTISKG